MTTTDSGDDDVKNKLHKFMYVIRWQLPFLVVEWPPGLARCIKPELFLSVSAMGSNGDPTRSGLTVFCLTAMKNGIDEYTKATSVVGN